MTSCDVIFVECLARFCPYFLRMCKEYIKDIDQQSLNATIDRYQALKEYSWEIINISWNDPTHTEFDAEKAKEIMNIFIRSNEIFVDAVSKIKKSDQLPRMSKLRN